MKKWLSIIGAFLIAGAASAQEATVRKTTNVSIASRTEFRMLNKYVGDEDESITMSQLSIPLAIKFAITRNLALDLLGTAIVSSADGNELTGPRDVRARAVMMLADDRIMLNAGIVAPITASALDTEQMGASAMLADRSMRFQYSNLGEGFDISINGGVAEQFGPVVLGAGGGYIKKGEYVLTEDPERDYLPGDQIAATVGADMASDSLLVRVDGTYKAYNPDQLDGEEVYQEDDKIAAQMIALLKSSVVQLLMSGRYTIRRDEGIFESSSLRDTVSLYGNQVDAKAYLRFLMSSRFSMMLLGDFSMIQKNKNDLNDSQLFGFGAGLTIRNQSISYFTLEGRYYIGTADDGDTSLDGFSVVCSIYLSR